MLDWLFKKKAKEVFRFKTYGRAGDIIYNEGQRSCKIEYELSGVSEYHILLFFDSLKNWNTPEQTPISAEEKQTIRIKLEEWLTKKKLKAQF